MFNFLKTKNQKIADTISDIFKPCFFRLVQSGSYTIKDIKNDDFLMGYMTGSISIAARLQGISGENSGLIIALFYENLFQSNYEDRLDLLKLIMHKSNTSETYNSSFKLGGKEFQLMTNGTDELPTLQKYIRGICI